MIWHAWNDQQLDSIKFYLITKNKKKESYNLIIKWTCCFCKVTNFNGGVGDRGLIILNGRKININRIDHLATVFVDPSLESRSCITCEIIYFTEGLYIFQNNKCQTNIFLHHQINFQFRNIVVLLLVSCNTIGFSRREYVTLERKMGWHQFVIKQYELGYLDNIVIFYFFFIIKLDNQRH